MKIRILAAIMTLIVLLSVVYVFFGKNWFAEQQYLQQQKNTEFIKNELMEKFLEIQDQSQEILDELLNLNYEIEFIPTQEISMEKDWSFKFDFDITSKPLFDHKQIYLISGCSLIVFDKKCKKVRWRKAFDEDIVDIEFLDVNRLLILTKSKNMFCLNRNLGREIWTKENAFTIKNSEKYCSVYQISLDKYKRLDSSVILVLSDKRIDVLNTINGKVLASHISEDNIRFISEFDLLEKCVYIVEGNDFSKINFRVKS